MSSKANSPGSAGGKSDGGASAESATSRADPFSIDEMYKLWLAPWQNVFPGAMDPARDFGADYLSSLFSKGPPQTSALISLVTQAYMHCLASGVSLAGRLSESTVRCQRSVAETLQSDAYGSASEDEKTRMMVDEARGCLRGVMEACTQEGKALQARLLDIDEAMRQLVGSPQTSAGASARRNKTVD